MRGWAIGVLSVLVAGCATPPPTPLREMVVVLPDADGKVGKVVVNPGPRELVLDSAYAAARTEGEKTRQDRANPEELRQVFGSTLAAQPQKPFTMVLHFIEGKDELTEDSRLIAGKVFAEIAKRPAPEVIIYGHTDTVGSDADNLTLSQRRANRVREDLVRLGVSAAGILAEGRGERELQVPTADNVAEPRNRRVEIVVR